VNRGTSGEPVKTSLTGWWSEEVRVEKRAHGRVVDGACVADVYAIRNTQAEPPREGRQETTFPAVGERPARPGERLPRRANPALLAERPQADVRNVAPRCRRDAGPHRAGDGARGYEDGGARRLCQQRAARALRRKPEGPPSFSAWRARMHELRWSAWGRNRTTDTGIFRPGAGVAKAAEQQGKPQASPGAVAHLQQRQARARGGVARSDAQ
jgi:hypothetical protein